VALSKGSGVDVASDEGGRATRVTAAPADERSGQTPAVKVGGLTKSFRRANGTTIVPVDDVTLTIAQGEFLVLLGPSGCGKTTLLRCIAGLDSPNSGTIDIYGKRVFDSSRRVNLPPEQRGIGMIFQSYALWPHMTVFKNVAYPLEAAKVPRSEIKDRVMAALDLVGVGDIAEQVPGKLSGGQQQRVSLARALVAEPRLVLFDEPLSNVDAKVREELRVELVSMQRRLGFAAVYVTHDQSEAMELADRIAVLGEGKIRQIDVPHNVYRRPQSSYVARFIGRANEVSGHVVTTGDGTVSVRIEDDGPAVQVPGPPSGAATGDKVTVIWRPEATRIESGPAMASADRLTVAARILFKRFLGPTTELVCETASGRELRVSSSGDLDYETGEEITLSVSAADLNVFPEGEST